MVLEAILRVVPQEIISMLTVKTSIKQAWDAITSMCINDNRVCKASSQQLQKEVEATSFRDGETIDYFAMRLSGLITNLGTLGETIEE